MHPLDIVFWTCFLLGGVYTLFTLLAGGLSHGAGHVHPAGGHLHLPHAHLPHAHHAGPHAQASHGGHAHHGGQSGQPRGHARGGGQADSEGEPVHFNLLALLNPMSTAGFLVGFGACGIVSRMLGGHPLGSAVVGLAGGSAMWVALYLLATRVFGAAEGTSHNRQEDVIGLRGQVTAPIDGLKPGMVAYTVAGARQTVRAICEDEEPIPTGAAVRIRKIENNTAHVMRID